MKVLILGAAGMLGYGLHRVLADRGFDVVGAVRGAAPAHPWTKGLRYINDIDIREISAVQRAVERYKATIVINAAGIIKQIASANDFTLLFAVNSVAPRRLQAALGPIGVRFVHFSTDCVFSGKRGFYSENDVPDAEDNYGLSKFLGEPAGVGCVVIRTSIIGLGLWPNQSLVDWFLAQTGVVRAYRRAVFSGLPVHTIGELLADRILVGGLTGLWHLSAEPISKATLLSLIHAEWRRFDIRLEPDEEVVIDRSLDSSKLRAQLAWLPPHWSDLVAAMRKFYQKLGPRPN